MRPQAALGLPERGRVMPHVKDKDELWVLALLQRIIDRDRQDRDALPGSAVRHVKDAARILR